MLSVLLALIIALAITMLAPKPAQATPISTVLVKRATRGEMTAKIIEILTRQLKERCGVRVVTSGKAEWTVELSVKTGAGKNGYTIADGPNGSIQIIGHDEPGLLYGVGKMLRDGLYSPAGFTPGTWRGSSVPKMPVRGIYFATHFHNFYHDAPVQDVQRYVEALALWGVNNLMVWFDMHHFNGINDPAAQKMIERLRMILQTAKSLGMGRGLGLVANEGYANSPVELRATGPGRGAFFGIELCPNKPGGKQLIVQQFRDVFGHFKDIGITDLWIWPYDSGSCACEQCSPWGTNGFLTAAKPVAMLARECFPGVKLYLSTWFLDEGEWEGLAKAFKTKPDWVDALISQPNTYAFSHESPGRLPLLGFPEISMDGMWPWGGFGANPQPHGLQGYWDGFKAKSGGGFPYSEGIYEDINKAVCAQLYWSPDRPVEDILKEYIRYEYSPEVTTELMAVIATLERNHHMRWWPGLLEGYTGWFPSKGAAPQDDPGAETAYAMVKKVDSRLSPEARKSWRWRVIFLRALTDAELKANGGKPNAACERAFEELTLIYHAQGAIVDLKPPATPKHSEGDITRLAAGITSTATGPATAPTQASTDVKDLWVPTFRPIAMQAGKTVSQTIDGTWRINPQAPKDVAGSELTGAGWTDFRVPGQWANQGFDLAEDAVAALGTDFTIPAAYKGKRIFLRFDAVHGGTQYWLNGTKLGETQYYFTPVEFEITPVAKPGQLNRLRITQTRNVPGEKLQYSGYRAQQQPPETGLLRSVHVFALPQLHISGLQLITNLDRDYRDADLVLNLSLDNPATAPASDVSVELTLRDASGRLVKLAKPRHDLEPLALGASERTLTVHVPNPVKWSDEKPMLYSLTIALSREGKIIQKLEQHVGFRKVETRDRQILLNGVPIKLHGACHHEFDPLTQRSGTGKLAEQDVQLLKAANVNYCRTTHYPPTKEFLDACDKQGIFVEVECPFMWTRFVPGEDDPAYIKLFADPTAAAVVYHRNHPSVIMWSLSNESGLEPWHQPNRLPVNYQTTNKLVKRLDPTRLTCFHNEWNDDGRTTDVGNLHYVTPPYDTSPWITGDPRPVVCGEMYLLVGMGWKGPYLELDPGLSEFWSMGNNIHWFKHTQKMSDVQANWEHDENLAPTHGQNSPQSGYNISFWSKQLAGMGIWEAVGPHGIIDEWRRPKNEWWAVKRMFSPVYIPTRQVEFAPGIKSIKVPIENRYSFTDLRELKLSSEISETGVIDSLNPPYHERLHGIAISLPPMSKGELSVPIPAGAKAGQTLIIRATDSKGRLVTAVGILLGNAIVPALPAPTKGALEVQQQVQSTIVHGENFAFALNHATGAIEPVQGAPGIALRAFPSVFALSYWDVEAIYKTITQLPASDERVIDSVTTEARENSLAITVADHTEEFSGSTTMCIDKAGVCTISYDHTYTGTPIRIGQAGERFKMDSHCRSIAWKRQSEWDVYPDDTIGRPEGKAMADRDIGAVNLADKNTGYLYPAVIIKPGEAAKPSWPCRLDTTVYGTSDFRATKFNITEASLSSTEGSGIKAFGRGDVHVRACLAKNAVLFHLWQPSEDGRRLEKGSRITGSFTVSLLTEDR
ncbi:MAG: glycoside hydrolase family 2 protein [Armatimonadota bacterium]